MDVTNSKLVLTHYYDHLLHNAQMVELEANPLEHWKVACLQLRINGRLCLIPVAQIAKLSTLHGPLEPHSNDYGCWQQLQEHNAPGNSLEQALLDVSALAAWGVPNKKFLQANWEGLVIGLVGQSLSLLADHNVGIVQLFANDFKTPEESGHSLSFPWMTRVLPYGNNPLWQNSVWLLDTMGLIDYVNKKSQVKHD